MLKVAKIILHKCMGVKKHETVLIVTDYNKVKLARPFFKYAKKIVKESLLLEMKPRKINGDEPPLIVAEAMKRADVVLILTTKSLSHTHARKNACKAGARIASLPGITEGILKRAVDVDYKKMDRLNRKLTKLLTKASIIRITTSKGSDLTFSIKGRKGLTDSGIYNKKGKWGNLPAGEAAIGPVERTADGVYIVDGSQSGIARLREPLKVIVERGYAVKFNGKHTKEMNNLIKGLGKSATNIAELGIGTNPRAIIAESVLEDEKVMGTAHIAIGDNISLGGKVKAKCHLDGVIRNPTIYLDNRKIMQNGKLLI